MLPLLSAARYARTDAIGSTSDLDSGMRSPDLAEEEYRNGFFYQAHAI